MSQRALGQFAARAQRAAAVLGEVNVLVTSSAEMQRLNRRYRRKDRPTDVLSFAANHPQIAGDIVVCGEISAQSARRLGHSAAEEIKILILHGMLHLAGYDHERDRGEMARKERQLRRALRLPTGLIERNGTARKGRRR